MIRTLLTTLGAGLLVGGVALAGASTQGRAAGTAVRLDPPSQNVDVSDGEFEIKVMVEEVDKLGAFEFQLDFDPELIEFVDWEGGPFLDSAGGTPTCPTSVSTDKDRVLFGCAVAAESGAGCATPGASGSGQLGTLRFKPKASGTSTLVFSKGQMSLPQINFDACGGTNYDIFFTITDGAVTVYDGAEPTSVPATPVPDAARLTPTAVNVSGTPVGGAILSPTQPSGVAGSDSTRGGSGSPGSSGAPGAAARGATGGVAGNTASGAGAPGAGHGPQEEHDNSGLLWGFGLAAAGAAVLGGGVVARRRGWRLVRNSYDSRDIR